MTGCRKKYREDGSADGAPAAARPPAGASAAHAGRAARADGRERERRGREHRRRRRRDPGRCTDAQQALRGEVPAEPVPTRRRSRHAHRRPGSVPRSTGPSPPPRPPWPRPTGVGPARRRRARPPPRGRRARAPRGATRPPASPRATRAPAVPRPRPPRPARPRAALGPRRRPARRNAPAPAASAPLPTSPPAPRRPVPPSAPAAAAAWLPRRSPPAPRRSFSRPSASRPPRSRRGCRASTRSGGRCRSSSRSNAPASPPGLPMTPGLRARHDVRTRRRSSSDETQHFGARGCTCARAGCTAGVGAIPRAKIRAPRIRPSPARSARIDVSRPRAGAQATAATTAHPRTPPAEPRTTADSDRSGQVGSQSVNAPVRVLSDGDDAGAAGSAGRCAGSSDGSSGGAQVGSQTASAPVRVASDGDGGTSSAAPADGGQTATGSEGATQVGSVGAEVPVSVLSNDGDHPDTTGGDDGAEVVEEVTEAGVGALAEVLDRGIREAAAATGSTTDGTVTTPVLRGVARLLETSAAALRGVCLGCRRLVLRRRGAAGTLGSGGLAEPPDSGGIGDTAVLRGEGGASLPSARDSSRPPSSTWRGRSRSRGSPPGC